MSGGAGALPVGREEAVAAMLDLLAMAPEQRRALLRKMPQPALRALLDEWTWQAGDGQIGPACAPGGAPWRVWALVAGRGYGKTRAGAEWVWARVREAGMGTVTSDCPLRIALVGASLDEVARVMVEGESGLLATARCDEAPRWLRSRGLLKFGNGAEAHAYSAERPEGLRGPQHHYAWCDELAKWPGHGKAEAAWDNLMLGLRLGERPLCVVTTTPRPAPALKRVLGLERTARTSGRTDENPDNAADFRASVYEMYGGTRLGRQELDGVLLDEFEGALWTRGMIERARAAPVRREELERVVIGVDPPASTGGDSCGIVVCGKDGAGSRGSSPTSPRAGFRRRAGLGGWRTRRLHGGRAGWWQRRIWAATWWRACFARPTPICRCGWSRRARARRRGRSRSR